MSDGLSQVFAALADPTRRAIVARLTRGSATVSELAEPFRKSMSLPAITKHIQVLEKAGLVVKGRSAQKRPCELNARVLKDAAEWMEEVRQFWEESFDRLEEHLKTIASQKRQKGTTDGPAP